MKTGGTQSAFAQSAKLMMNEWAGSRKKVSLWLDLKITRELEALEIIQRMKSKREFRKSVMVGLKIIFELKQGKVDTLLAEFPNIRELLGVKAGQGDSEGGRLDKIENMLEIIATQQKTGLTMQSAQPAPKPLPGLQPVASNPKPLAAPSFALPAFDDEDDELPTLKLANSTINTAANLVNAAMRLQH